jgi:multiple sugar transport system permease protein
VNKFLWLMAMPWVITLAVFWIFPLVHAFVLSFSQYATLTNTIEFIGFDNYQRVWHSPEFWNALKNTIIFTFGTVPVTTSLAIVLAILVQRQAPSVAKVFRAAYFLPSVTSLVVIALVFMNLYSQQGYINTLWACVGLPTPPHGWLQTPGTALFSIMAMDVWISVGYYMVLFMAGLEAIPKDLYESAELQGASRLQQFWRITLPLLRPTLLFVVVINSIKSFQVFVEVYVMTKGGPLGATSTLVYEVYTHAFDRTDSMGYASALAYVVFVIILAVSMFQMRLLRTKG